MDEKNRNALAKVRIERAQELLEEAKRLMVDGAYKSANNRAYYSFEKSIKALLALKFKDAKTHAGVLHLFNSEYVHNGEYFTHEDYVKFKDSEFIRTASDYDDFYIAAKEDSQKQIENAEYMIKKVEKYLSEFL
ncbi:MAG: HEPN domain-containing protein [Lachnospiraceae bacterium]|nr:HEPN domain-containing protein [Lachnospiraceae bacterium]